MTCGIYKIYNKVNEDFYIGSSKNIEARLISHLSLARNKKHHSIIFQRAYEKYGESSFDFELVEACSESDLLKKEQFYINKLKPKYNISPLAHAPSPPDNKPILRTCVKTGETKVYKTRDEAASDGFNEGEITACCLGRAGQHKGYFWSFKGDTVKSSFTDHSTVKPVVKINPKTGQRIEYGSITEAASSGEFNASSISACCLKKNNTHKGFLWFFKDDKEQESYNYNSNRQRPKSKLVIRECIETGDIKEYDKVSLVSQDGFSMGNVIACCNGKRGSHKGYRWYYKDSAKNFVPVYKKVLRIDPKTGEEKIYESRSDTVKDGFSAQKVGACILGRRKMHKGYVWKEQ